MEKGIHRLVEYGISAGLVEREDAIYTKNRLLEYLGLEALEAYAPEPELPPLEDLLADLNEKGEQAGLWQGGVAARDAFDAGMMGILTPPPSQVIRRFWGLYKQVSPQAATAYYYRLSQASDYIRSYRVAKDRKWQVETPYGVLDITINLSKPEKDPRDIALAGQTASHTYPLCLLCAENEGYAGRPGHPARQNHRIIPLEIGGQPWFLQYSPYVYYNEHCIALNAQHTPMRVDDKIFGKLLDFVDYFPHYFIGSNADLPIVGGSILSHEHFQGGNHSFAMARAAVEREFAISAFPSVRAGVVAWPMSVIRLSCGNRQALEACGAYILEKWRAYSDGSARIFARTGAQPHNTITPIARRRDGEYELDLVLRNNMTTKEHPMGLYHPHEELHHIKKENIGLIEVMGLAVLPSRLMGELEEIRMALEEGRDVASIETLAHHAHWVKEICGKWGEIPRGLALQQALEQEVGLVFAKVLEHAGVFARTPEGGKAFARFTDTL